MDDTRQPLSDVNKDELMQFDLAQVLCKQIVLTQLRVKKDTIKLPMGKRKENLDQIKKTLRSPFVQYLWL